MHVPIVSGTEQLCHSTWYQDLAPTPIGKIRSDLSGVQSYHSGDFPGGAVVKNPPARAGDTGLSPGPGRSHMSWSN